MAENAGLITNRPTKADMLKNDSRHDTTWWANMTVKMACVSWP